MDIDRRQFIICNRKINRQDFGCIDLPCSMFLNYHKDLPVKKIGDTIILGLVFPITPDYSVEKSQDYPIEELIKKWGGRFVVYDHGMIYTDATSSFGLFYIETTGCRIISSSIHLIVTEYGISRNSKYELDYRGHGDTWDFYPGPYTPYGGVKRLMQYERLDCFGKKFVVLHVPEWNNAYKSKNPLELTEVLVQYMAFMLQQIAKEYDGIWVPLTGGIDSRCVCAWCKAADIPFSTYTEERTYETHGAELTQADRELPGRISERLGTDWSFCRMREWDKKRWNSILQHSMGMVRNTNLYSYAYDQYPQKQNKNIILHGSIFEISREYYRKSMGGELFDFDARKTALNRWLRGNLKKSGIHRKSLFTWLKDIEIKGNQEMAWYDRFYYEQRLGSWLSDLNQAMDIIDFDRISPANNYEIISILLAYPREMRTSGEHQKMIIDACAPGLDELPINPSTKIERLRWYYDRSLYKLRDIIHKKPVAH